MQSDPVADMLTRIRNGCQAHLESVLVPWSQLKVKLAEVLKREGYIKGFRLTTVGQSPHKFLEVELKYDSSKESVVTGLKRISTPGLRRYFHSKKIPKIRSGLGVVILTTSRGLMTDREARKAGIGGEALCSVW